MTIRVAAIGMKHWHSLYDSAYLRHLADMPDVEIVGVHDDDPTIAAHRVQAIQCQAPTFTNYQEMLQRVQPDFVLALGRHDQMAAIASDLLDAHIPFIMEKPMSFNARQLHSVVEKTRAMSGFAAVPLGTRWSPIMQCARQYLDAGTYGPMTHFSWRLNRPTSARYVAWDSPWMLDPQLANGGCLRNLGTHGLDCFVYLTGEGTAIDVVGAQLSWATHQQPVEDYAVVLLRSERGVLGTIEVGNTFPRNGRDSHCKVGFYNAMLIADGDSVIRHTADGETELPVASSQPGRADSILRQTLDAATNGEPPPVNALDCYCAVRLIDLAYLAAGNPYGTAEV